MMKYSGNIGDSRLKEYELSYLPIFDDDLAEAWNYITFKLKNPAAANKLLVDTEKAILKRLKTPAAFQKYPSKKERKYPYYRIQVRNFTIWYVVIGNIMEVRRFLYSKRNIEGLIL
jgi:plasmid stabilization system protein ParE